MANEIPGTAEPEVTEVPEVAEVPETPETPTPGKETPGVAPAKEEESFIDPSTLPPELKAHWKRMHGAYTKTREELKQGREAVTTIQRFYKDPDFALQTIEQAATHLGYRLVAPGQAVEAAKPQLSEVPKELVQAVAARLPQGMEWLAESLAASVYDANKVALAPMQKRADEDAKAIFDREYGDLSTKLAESAPGWEAHEDEMKDLDDFLNSGKLTHPRWGSRLQLLYNLATGQAHATQQALNRMATAAKNRTVTGSPGREVIPNVTDKIRKARNRHEAFEVAAQAAVDELKAQGITVPD